MRRREFLTTAVGAALGSGLAASGCGVLGGDGEPTVLRLFTAELGDVLGQGSTEQYWRGLATRFREERPDISVVVSSAPRQEASTAVVELVNRGQAPDIAQVGTIADFAARGALYPATELLNVPVLSGLVPNIASAGKVRHIQYGMPVAARVGRLFYNRSLFEEAGLDPDEPPTDWEALLDAASALRDAGTPVPFGLPLGHDDAQDEALVWMLGGGGALTDVTGGYVINSDENVATFRWLRDELSAAGRTGRASPAETTREEVLSGFTEGSVGMLSGDSTLVWRAEAAGLAYGTAAMPGRSGPTRSAVADATWLLGFNQAGHREEIAAFLDFVFRPPSGVASFAGRHGLLPASSPEVEATLQGRSQQERALRPFLTGLPTATFFPVGKASWSIVAGSLARGIRRVMQPRTDVQQVLDELQREAESAEELR
ncbi:ABC transporter substrate-binding protein [Streptomyces hoynatensis]|uniref:Carbohydrate ABC transporter substrate-binding protein n=1 Tax=Streptomyces hoynatensis TaxID=1141874 RepID=A0A3A9Z094_9ACTN|nr:ABC transporter substrate-binding protein [Streptomyces hoynatensis]RKN41761.1 carbohydrate ABC transporter substrate-binding protein [Streptomyces hoynatensis]